MFCFGARIIYNGIRTAFRGGRGPIPRPPNQKPPMGVDVNKEESDEAVDAAALTYLLNRRKIINPSNLCRRLSYPGQVKSVGPHGHPGLPPS